MAMAAAVAADLRPATVTFTHQGTFERGFFRVGREAMASPEGLSQVGWRVQFNRDKASVRAEGRVVEVPARQVDGQRLVSLQDLLRELEARGAWTPGTDEFIVTGDLAKLEIRNNAILLASTLDAKVSLRQMSNPSRLVVDLEGVSMDPARKLRLAEGVRIGQYTRTTLRLVVEADGIDRVSIPRQVAGKAWEISTGTVALKVDPEPTPVAKKNPPQTPEANGSGVIIIRDDHDQPKDDASSVTETTPAGHTVDSQPAEPTLEGLIRLGAPRVTRQLNGNILLQFPLSGRLPNGASVTQTSSTAIEITAPRSRPEQPGSQGKLAEGIEQLTTEADRAGISRIQIQTAQPFGVQVDATGTSLNVLLVRPRSADGTLRGKVIVIDPGHGGKDSGAVGPDKKLFEKNLVLAISRRMADELTAGGATVILTRNDDTYPTLTARSDLANRSRADLFVSVHINSNRVANTASGVIIFYHGGSTMGKLLAQCINEAVVRVSQLREWAPMSDKRIHKSGFAVLRNTTMPGVLCELGFINNDRDRSLMVRPEWQAEIAKAISQGIRVFLGDVKANPDRP